MISIDNLSKIYSEEIVALRDINLEVKEGEIFALLGPNGAGKTTLISAICGLTIQTSGNVKVGGFDTLKDYKLTRSLIGLVPQELPLENYENVFNTVSFTRGLFGKTPKPKYIEKLLKKLKLWEKKSSQIFTLSGGMKRRVLIAKALSHEPKILFLDEPTAGVDVQLRREMWDLVLDLKNQGVTVILTTHYIREAEIIADRVGILNKGSLLLVEEKKSLISKFGKRQMLVDLNHKLTRLTLMSMPKDFKVFNDGHTISFELSTVDGEADISSVLKLLAGHNLNVKDIKVVESSLEDIFLEIIAMEPK